MSEERLQEIKDSIEFQYTLAKVKGHENALLFTDEEQELVEEIERLHSIIKEVREYIKDRYDGEALIHTFDKDNVKELLKLLDKVGDNNVKD